MYIDENKDKWEYSRQVINALILTPDSEVPSSGELPPRQDKPTEAVAEDKPIEDDVSPEETLSNFLSSLSTTPESEKTITETPAAPLVEAPTSSAAARTEAAPKPQPKHERRTDPDINYDLFTLMDNTQSDFFVPTSKESPTSVEFEIAEKQVEREEKLKSEKTASTVTETPPASEPKAAETPTVTVPAPAEPEVKSKPAEPEPTASVRREPPKPTAIDGPGGKDDRFNSDEARPADYKYVLSRIFKTPSDKPAEAPRDAEYTEGFDVKTFFSSGEDVIVEEEKTETPAPPRKPPHKKQKPHPKYDLSDDDEYTTVHHPYYDFSDIQGMAEKEGFKVKISAADKARESGRIFINKLLFHSATLFFVILFVETLILYFTTSNTAGLDFAPYAIFIGILAIFPLTTAVMYYLNKNRKVTKIATFKSAVELLTIIMLNLILIIIVCCVLSNIDFSNQQSVLKFIVYPTFFVLNLPIYLIIKYLKLDKDKYFD